MLLKHWLTVVLCTIAGVGVAITVTLMMTPQYQATASLYVMARSPSSQNTSDVVQGGSYARSAVLSYIQVAKKAIVLQPVVDKLDLDVTAEQLANRISATSPTNTVLINIAVTDPVPSLAADIANATAESLARVVMNELEKPDAETLNLVKLTLTQEATVPRGPSSPNLLMNIAVGLIAGAAVGVGVAWLRSVLDTRIQSTADLTAATGAPLLGTIPFNADAPARPLVVQEDPQSPSAEEYRGLRTNLIFSNVGGKGQCILISSSNPGEGKSTTSCNLAITLADSGRRVVLIDCDFRRPAIARYLRLEGGAGLSDVLVGRVQPVDVLQRWGTENFYVLPAGRTPPNPSELLGSALMQDLIGFLLKSFDYVIIDSPPLLVATDATILSKVADGVVLVASYDGSRKHALSAAANTLAMVGSKLLGSVLTKIPPKKIGGYRSGYGSGYGYGLGYGYGYGYSPSGRGGERSVPAPATWSTVPSPEPAQPGSGSVSD
jgi:capsular exopolysaccharide synthesis family protein